MSKGNSLATKVYLLVNKDIHIAISKLKKRKFISFVTFYSAKVMYINKLTILPLAKQYSKTESHN